MVFNFTGGNSSRVDVAAVCREMSGRVARAAIVSRAAPEMPGLFKGMWPPVYMIFFTARHFPALNRMAPKQMGAFYADQEQMMKRMKQALPAPDVALIDAHPEVIDVFSASAKEAHRSGLEGDAWEWRMYVQP